MRRKRLLKSFNLRPSLMRFRSYQKNHNQRKLRLMRRPRMVKRVKRVKMARRRTLRRRTSRSPINRMEGSLINSGGPKPSRRSTSSLIFP